MNECMIEYERTKTSSVRYTVLKDGTLYEITETFDNHLRRCLEGKQEAGYTAVFYTSSNCFHELPKLALAEILAEEPYWGTSIKAFKAKYKIET